MIERSYPHRIEADPETCPVCCGDRETDDRRFGGEMLRQIGDDHNRYPIYKCLACDVYLNRKQRDAPLPTSPDGTDWGIYGDTAREQWNGMEYEAHCMDREWQAHDEDAEFEVGAKALRDNEERISQARPPHTCASCERGENDDVPANIKATYTDDDGQSVTEWLCPQHANMYEDDYESFQVIRIDPY